MLRGGGGRDKEEGSPCCAWIWIRSELVLNVLIKSRARAWSLLSLRRRHYLLVKMESAFDPGLIYMMGNSLHPNSFRYTCLIIARHGSEPRNLVQNPTRSFDHLLLFPPPRALCQNKVPFCFLSSFRARARERERPQQIPLPKQAVSIQTGGSDHPTFYSRMSDGRSLS